MLTIYDWIYGIVQLTAVFLALGGALIALSMVKHCKKKNISSWKFLIVTFVLLAIVEIIGASAVFSIFRPPFIAYFITPLIFITIIAALINQIMINKGCLK